MQPSTEAPTNVDGTSATLPSQIEHARPNRVEVDAAAIAGNIWSIRRALRSGTKIYAALKANAYGFGLDSVARIVCKAGVDGIALTDQRDAIALRQAGIRLPILLYGGNLADESTVAAAIRHDLTPTLLDHATAELYSRLATRPVPVFVKIDVGLERLGLIAEEAADFVAWLGTLPRLELRGLYTHAAVPANADPAFLEWQVKRFRGAVDSLAARGIRVPIRMFASSASLRQLRGIEFDAVDPGHMLFGLNPGGGARVEFELHSALRRITTRLIQVKPVTPHEFPDQSPFPLRHGLRVGVIPVGLHDGLHRFNAGFVLVRGKPARFLGGISLEHARIDVSEIKGAATGDEVAIIGAQGETAITVEDAMRHHGYARTLDLMMAVSSSIPRVHVERG